jgi:hypothetical protein
MAPTSAPVKTRRESRTACDFMFPPFAPDALLLFGTLSNTQS